MLRLVEEEVGLMGWREERKEVFEVMPTVLAEWVLGLCMARGGCQQLSMHLQQIATCLGEQRGKRVSRLSAASIRSRPTLLWEAIPHHRPQPAPPPSATRIGVKNRH